MKRRSWIGLVLVLVVLGPALWYVGRPHYHAAVCRSNLAEICRMSLIYAGDFDEVYPDSLKRLLDFGLDSSFLTCPAVGTPPAAGWDIDRWSGYTLVAGITTGADPNSILVYCPPENHNGRCGHIAFTDTHVETFEKDEFDTFLAEQGIVRTPQGP